MKKKRLNGLEEKLKINWIMMDAIKKESEYVF